MKPKSPILLLLVLGLSIACGATDWDSARVENLEIKKMPWEEAVREVVSASGLHPSELKIEYAPDVLSIRLESSLKGLGDEERKRLWGKLQSSIQSFIQTTDYRVSPESEDFGPIRFGSLPLSKALDLLSSNGYEPESRTIVVQNRLDLTAFCTESKLSPTEDSEIIETIKVLLRFKFFSLDVGGFIDFSTTTGDDLIDLKNKRKADIYAIEALLSEGHDQGIIQEFIRYKFAWCGEGMNEVEADSKFGGLIKAFEEHRKKAHQDAGINSVTSLRDSTP